MVERVNWVSSKTMKYKGCGTLARTKTPREKTQQYECLLADIHIETYISLSLSLTYTQTPKSTAMHFEQCLRINIYAFNNSI